MAFRLDEQVVRGEIDNRVRGRVTGRIWFADRDTPVELALKGNAWRDLAGRRLEFINPHPKSGASGALQPRQTGVIGDCTASRKVKVPDVSDEELMRRMIAHQPFPWHWGNCLYLEWFSETNGRIVIESAAFELRLVGDAAWEMSAREEEEQQQRNREALSEFTRRIFGSFSAAPEAESDPTPEPDAPPPEPGPEPEPWQPERPMTEAEAEAIQAETDKFADRIQARLDREGEDADLGQILREEIERRRRERKEPPLTPEQEAERAAWIEEMNRAAEEAAQAPDADTTDELDRKHPLAEEALDLTVRLHQDVEVRHWLPTDASPEHPVAVLLEASSNASAKLAGALNGQEWPPPVDFCANDLVRLKRAHSYLEDARLAAADCAEQALVDAAWISAAQQQIDVLARGCAELIAELRARLERGFD